MGKTIIALYRDLATADKVLQELKDNGIERENVSLAVQDSVVQAVGYTKDTISPAEGVGSGALFGGLTGLLVGLGTFAIPGIGPILAAGPLAAALGGAAGAVIGAGTGAVVGGVTAALIDMGVPSETADEYVESVRQGNTLLTVRVNDSGAERAMTIVQSHHPVRVESHSANWPMDGTSGMVPTTNMTSVPPPPDTNVINLPPPQSSATVSKDVEETRRLVHDYDPNVKG